VLNVKLCCVVGKSLGKYLTTKGLNEMRQEQITAEKTSIMDHIVISTSSPNQIESNSSDMRLKKTGNKV
jgi:hypothetical protein